MISPAILQQLAQKQARHAISIPSQPDRVPCRNFLFLVGHGLCELDRLIVCATARKLSAHGHVYVADAEQEDVEDRDDIRYLPLCGGVLPNFGSISVVAVLRDTELARLAAEAYPEAKVYVIEHDLVVHGSCCMSPVAKPRARGNQKQPG